jgi:diguanylate cyclase (GGDEF)-like protein
MCLLVLAVLVPVTLGLDQLIQRSFDDARSRQGQQEAAQVDATVTQLGLRLADRVDLLVSHPDLAAMVAGGEEAPPAARLEEMRRQLEVDALTLVDGDRNLVAECSEGDKIHEVLAERAFREALEGRPSADVVQHESSFRLRATRPLVRDGQVVGALMGGYLLDGEDLWQILEGTGMHAAYALEGRVLAATLEEFERVPTAAIYEIKRRQVSARGGGGSDGFVRAEIEVGGLPHDVVLCPLPLGFDSGLVGTVVLMASAAEVIAARRSARRLIAAATTIGMLLAILLATLLSAGLTRPLRQLVEVARGLREGHLDRRTGLERGDELGELARAFDEMAASLEKQVAETQRLAVTDELTGLANRRKFREELARELERSRRFGLELALLMLDIDHFKQVNDTHGHPVGDQVLQAIAAVLGGGLRNIDLACRFGGEEFALLLPATPGADAVNVAERLRATVADQPLGPDGELVVTLSAGVASYPTDGETAAELVRVADMRLYAAKQGGRNRVIGPFG